MSHRFDPIVSQFAHEFLARETNVFDNLPQQKRRDITASVKRNGRASSIRMTILFMGAALTNFDKSHLFQERERSRAASVPAAEPSLNLNRFGPNELRFQFRLTIYEEH